MALTYQEKQSLQKFSESLLTRKSNGNKSPIQVGIKKAAYKNLINRFAWGGVADRPENLNILG